VIEKTSAQRSSSVTAAAGALAVLDSQDRSLDIREPRQWREAITRLVCHANITTAPSTRFSGTVRNTPLGCLNILEIESEYEYGARTRRHIAKDHNDNLVLVFVRSGILEITQLDRKVVLPPGMFSIYDLSQPYTYGHLHRTEVLAIKIPASMLGSRIGKIGRFIGQPYSAGAGVGRLTADFLKCVSREADHLPEAAAFSYGSQVIDLVGIMLECGSEKLPIAHSAVKSALYRRCSSFIRSQIANADLDPQTAADANGISARYLHRIFQEAGQTFGEFLRVERLQRCRRDLIDPAKSPATIGEIAYRAGFRTQSHFSKLFKKQFGVSPADMRRAAVRGSR
jgi:AraC family transcriptional regulator, positive regulator of tynA and feaB